MSTSVNMRGTWTLFKKEVRRFMKVIGQTVGTPVLTAMLYLLVFRQVMEGRMEVYPGIAYTEFLIPGLIMMSVIQNAFANAGSSLTQSKIMGNLIFVLKAPLAPWEIYLAFVAASILRASIVGVVLYLVAWFFVPLPLVNPLITFVMLLLSGGTLAALGVIAGVLAEKFDHLSAFQNFFIMPFSFLSGVFYSIHALPDFWREASRFNPFFYMIDGFRYGFFGVADAPVGTSLVVVFGFFVLVTLLCLALLHSGYKLRA